MQNDWQVEEVTAATYTTCKCGRFQKIELQPSYCKYNTAMVTIYLGENDDSNYTNV